MSQFSQRPIDDPAAAAALLLIRCGLIVLGFLVPLSAVVSRRAVYTLLPIGAGLLVLAATLLPRVAVGRRLGSGLSTFAGVGGLVLLIWSAASILWTPFPADAGLRWLKEGGTIIGVALVLASLPERTRTSNLYLFPLGLIPAGVATTVFGLVGAQRLSIFPEPMPRWNAPSSASWCWSGRRWAALRFASAGPRRPCWSSASRSAPWRPGRPSP